MLNHISICNAHCKKVELIENNIKNIMEQKNNCCGDHKCDFSKCDIDMTIRECLEAHGIDPKAVATFLKTCCKK